MQLMLLDRAWGQGPIKGPLMGLRKIRIWKGCGQGCTEGFLFGAAENKDLERVLNEGA